MVWKRPQNTPHNEVWTDRPLFRVEVRNREAEEAANPVTISNFCWEL